MNVCSKVKELTEEEKELQKRVEKLCCILSGEKPIYLHLQFLIRNDKTDPLILKNTKVKTYMKLRIVKFVHHLLYLFFRTRFRIQLDPFDFLALIRIRFFQVEPYFFLLINIGWSFQTHNSFVYTGCSSSQHLSHGDGYCQRLHA